jgi:hypothetical protein
VHQYGRNEDTEIKTERASKTLRYAEQHHNLVILVTTVVEQWGSLKDIDIDIRRV